MKIIQIIAVVTGLTLSCNQSANPENDAATDTAKSEEVKAMIPESACYAGTNGKDSFFLKLEVLPDVVTGKLDYGFAEKDKNTGEIDGVLSGDTLIADYTFRSEGSLSTRQVTFLVKDATVVEGYGPMEEKDGKMVFTDMGRISFSGTPLVKISCGER